MVGSFLNVVIHRLPAEGQSIVRPRSRCPHCQDAIPAWLNIPILSWVLLRGRCRKCKAPISIRYPAVELMTGVVFLAMLIRHGPNLAALMGMLMAAGLIAITFVDIDIWEIPDEISLPGIVIGAALRPFAFDVAWYDGLLGAAIGAGILWAIRALFFVVRKVEGMGLGDVKLIAMIGAFVGPMHLLPTILVASISGSIIGLSVWAIDRIRNPPGAEPEVVTTSDGASNTEEAPEPGSEADEEEDWVPPDNAVPFGPFLSLGALAAYLFGDQLPRLFIGY